MTNAQRNSSIDFIKGIATLSVVLLHNMPNDYVGSIVWIGQAVPLFLFVTAYLTYGSFQRGKSYEGYYSKSSVLKMLDRIFKPFIIMTLVQCIIFFFLKNDFSIKEVISSGGIGPGSYYPWLHLQAWIVLPLIIFVVDKVSINKSAVFFILICILLELVSSITQISGYVYRLAFYRYLFVLYLACVIRKYNLGVTISIIIMAFISLIFLLIMHYTKINFEPVFFNQWRDCHWLSYFYTAFVFLLLTKTYGFINNSKFACFFVLLGNYSYEIFLCQMFVYSLITLELFSFINNIYIQSITFIIITTILSIAPILVYKSHIKRIIKNE